MCDNGLALKQMKRFSPTSLALLLVMGSLGHVFAAVFCPRMLGHDCCLTKTSSHQHASQANQHMHRMAMDALTNDSMPMDGNDMQGMIMDDEGLRSAPVATNKGALLPTSEILVTANTLELPMDTCSHCMSHSGITNAPVSSVSVQDQSNKDHGSVLLPVSKFLTRPAMTLTQIELPKEHAPPGSSAPRHILISVFLI